MNKNVNLSFLFGSGAYTCYNENLKSGMAFSEILLTDKYSEERKNILGLKSKNEMEVYSYINGKTYTMTK